MGDRVVPIDRYFSHDVFHDIMADPEVEGETLEIRYSEELHSIHRLEGQMVDLEKRCLSLKVKAQEYRQEVAALKGELTRLRDERNERRERSHLGENNKHCSNCACFPVPCPDCGSTQHVLFYRRKPPWQPEHEAVWICNEEPFHSAPEEFLIRAGFQPSSPQHKNSGAEQEAKTA